MSSYSKMQAPPFWMGMFRIVGVACLITLLTPTFYLVKYSLYDHPLEEKLASSKPETRQAFLMSASPHDTDWYIKTAEGTGSSQIRTLATQRLGDLAASTRVLISYPVECLHAKLALEQVADSDPDPSVRSAARAAMLSVAMHGAVISR